MVGPDYMSPTGHAQGSDDACDFDDSAWGYYPPSHVLAARTQGMSSCRSPACDRVHTGTYWYANCNNCSTFEPGSSKYNFCQMISGPSAPRARGCKGSRANMGLVLEHTSAPETPEFLEDPRAGALALERKHNQKQERDAARAAQASATSRHLPPAAWCSSPGRPVAHPLAAAETSAPTAGPLEDPAAAAAPAGQWEVAATGRAALAPSAPPTGGAGASPAGGGCRPPYRTLTDFARVRAQDEPGVRVQYIMIAIDNQAAWILSQGRFEQQG